MAKIKYYIRSKKNPANIYMRFTIDRENYFRKKTNILVDPDLWDNKKGKVKGGDSELKKITGDLRKLTSRITDRYNEAIAQKIDVTND